MIFSKCFYQFNVIKTFQNLAVVINTKSIAKNTSKKLLKLFRKQFQSPNKTYELLEHFNRIMVLLDYLLKDRGMVHWVTASDNQWQQVVQRMTTSGITNDNEWCNKWQRVRNRVTVTGNKWKWMRPNKIVILSFKMKQRLIWFLKNFIQFLCNV